MLPVLLLSSQPVLADGIYYGAGLAYSDAESLEPSEGDGASSDSYFGLGATVGYRWNQPTSFFAAEADFDLPLDTDFEDSGASCSTDADTAYYCTHTATLRLRGIAGVPMGGFEGFVSGGLMMMSGDGAIDSDVQDRGVNTGYTVGLGLQQDLGGSMLRYELIYDNAENTSTKPGGIYEPSFEALTAKVTFLFN
jgi:opacity protein-like surface antigen